MLIVPLRSSIAHALQFEAVWLAMCLVADTVFIRPKVPVAHFGSIVFTARLSRARG